MMQMSFDQAFTKLPENMSERLIHAKREKAKGMQRVSEKAEHKDPTFGERARCFVIAYLTEHGDTSGETLVTQAVKAGIKPHDERAFGSVFGVLAKRKQIRKVGNCIRLKGHASEGGKVWGLYAK